jgi:hypothetical protein
MIDLRNLRQQIDAILATASKQVEDTMSSPPDKESGA